MSNKGDACEVISYCQQKRLKQGNIAVSEQVILVTPNNRTLGYGEKMAVHRKGLLHRAFSVFLIDDEGRMLLQRRYEGKYHSGGLWANSACGHPRPKEPIRRAAERRTFEELGVRVSLTDVFRTLYRAELDHGMTEHELVTVFFGRLKGKLNPDPEEVSETALVAPADVKHRMTTAPETFARWMQHYVRDHFPKLQAAAHAQVA